MSPWVVLIGLLVVFEGWLWLKWHRRRSELRRRKAEADAVDSD